MRVTLVGRGPLLEAIARLLDGLTELQVVTLNCEVGDDPIRNWPEGIPAGSRHEPVAVLKSSTGWYDEAPPLSRIVKTELPHQWILRGDLPSWGLDVVASLLAYQIGQNAAVLTLFLEHGERGLQLEHREAWCLRHMAGSQEDELMKARVGDICATCLQEFEEVLSPRLLHDVVELIGRCRHQVLHSGRYVASLDARLPFPVAVTKRKALLEEVPIRRYFRLIDHLDCVMRYACFVGAVVQDAQHGQGAACASGLLNGDGFKRPSLGKWQGFLAQKVGGVDKVADAAKLCLRHVTDRNELRGHGWIQSEAVMYRKADDLLRDLGAIEETLMSIFRRKLICLQGADWRLLRGSSPASLARLDPAKRVLPRGAVAGAAFIGHEDNWLPLGAFICMMTCTTCQAPRVTLFDGEAKRLDAEVGHRFNHP